MMYEDGRLTTAMILYLHVYGMQLQIVELFALLIFTASTILTISLTPDDFKSDTFLSPEQG